MNQIDLEIQCILFSIANSFNSEEKIHKKKFENSFIFFIQKRKEKSINYAPLLLLFSFIHRIIFISMSFFFVLLRGIIWIEKSNRKVQ